MCPLLLPLLLRGNFAPTAAQLQCGFGVGGTFVDVAASFVSANTLHILMEFCSGGSLQQVLSRRERNEEVFDEENGRISHLER